MERLGRYMLLEPIASGGMAEVFRGVALGPAGFRRAVAIKRILPHLTKDGSVVQMLLEEARIAASLNHPNVVRVLDLGEDGGSHFIVMDYIAGQPLSAVMQRATERGERLPLGFCFRVVEQALRGLSYVHERRDASGAPMGLVHRDISPQNIMLTYDGTVLLVDFGIVKAADRAALTMAGTLKGKPGYMSPEIVKGHPVTPLVDIYAMGVVMHELVTLQPLRAQRAPLQMLAEARKGAFPRFESLGLRVPEPAAAVIYRALAPDPEDRWPDAESLRQRVQDVSETLQWSWDAQDVGVLMRRYFPAEVAREEAAAGRLQSITLPLLPPGVAVSDLSPADIPTEPAVAAPPRTVVMSAERPQGRSVAVAVGLAAMCTLALGAVAPWARGGVTDAALPVMEASAVLQAGAACMAPELPMASVFTVALAPPEEPAPPPMEQLEPGWLLVQSRPWARVYIDGKDTGRYTPLVDLELPAGTHTVQLVNPPLKLRRTFKVDVPAGKRVKLVRSLQ